MTPEDKDVERTFTAALLVTADRQFYPNTPELTVDVVRSWTPGQRLHVQEYGWACHFDASDNEGVFIPPTPEHLRPYL